jgi:hypothetical protein
MLTSDIIKCVRYIYVCRIHWPISPTTVWSTASCSNIRGMSNKMQSYTVYFIWKLLYMFRVVLPPIIRSAYKWIYSIWYLSQRYTYLPLSWKSWNWFELTVGGVRHPQIPDAVDTVVCSPDDGWWLHPKHVEQFPDKINCVTFHPVGYILVYS